MRDWDDLRHFLAVARAGSALAGARQIGVNQTTCARRVAALEAALGSLLFEKRQTGYRLTEAGQRVLAMAEKVEAEIAALTVAVQAENRRLTGRLRVTAAESLANLVLAPFLSCFHEAHPGVRVDLMVIDRKLAIGRGEADVALRAGPQPEVTGVAARRICALGWTVYGTQAYAARHGLPRSLAEMAGHAVMGGEGGIARASGLAAVEAVPGVQIVSRSDSLTNIAIAAGAGLCLAALPCMIGDRMPAMQRCFPPQPELGGELWLVVREELREVAHVRAFIDALIAHIGPLRPVLEGMQERMGEVASAAEPA